MTRIELIELFEYFLGSGSGGDPWAWDDFISLKSKHSLVEGVRHEALEIGRLYPPTKRGWCSDEGFIKLEDILRRLRSEKW